MNEKKPIEKNSIDVFFDDIGELFGMLLILISPLIGIAALVWFVVFAYRMLTRIGAL